MELLIPLLAISIPLVAIIAEHRLKMRKLGGNNDELTRQVRALAAKHDDLESRVQTLETIVTLDERPPRVRIEEEPVEEPALARVASAHERGST